MFRILPKYFYFFNPALPCLGELGKDILEKKMVERSMCTGVHEISCRIKDWTVHIEQGILN